MLAVVMVVSIGLFDISWCHTAKGEAGRSPPDLRGPVAAWNRRAAEDGASASIHPTNLPPARRDSFRANGYRAKVNAITAGPPDHREPPACGA
jgi:hypothetical protein